MRYECTSDRGIKLPDWVYPRFEVTMTVWSG